MLLWFEYQSQNPNGYSYSRFSVSYTKRSLKRIPVCVKSIKQVKMFCRFSGLTVPWTDKETCEIHHAQIFCCSSGGLQLQLLLKQPLIKAVIHGYKPYFVHFNFWWHTCLFGSVFWVLVLPKPSL